MEGISGSELRELLLSIERKVDGLTSQLASQGAHRFERMISPMSSTHQSRKRKSFFRHAEEEASAISPKIPLASMGTHSSFNSEHQSQPASPHKCSSPVAAAAKPSSAASRMHAHIAAVTKALTTPAPACEVADEQDEVKSQDAPEPTKHPNRPQGLRSMPALMIPGTISGFLSPTNQHFRHAPEAAASESSELRKAAHEASERGDEEDDSDLGSEGGMGREMTVTSSTGKVTPSSRSSRRRSAISESGHAPSAFRRSVSVRTERRRLSLLRPERAWRPSAIMRRLGLNSTLDRLGAFADTEMKRGETRPIWRAVHGARFQLFVASAIMLQGFFVGLGASNALHVEIVGSEPAEWIDVVEACFTCFFLLELLLRAYAEQVCFVLGPDWTWNLFDFLLVAMSVANLIARGTNSSQFKGATIGRILRLSRFCFLMRMHRVMRMLPSLRLILLAILDSMASLVWCFLFIAFVMYVFAVLIVYGAADCFGNGDICVDEANAAELKLWWGGIYRSMVTLFMSIAGGVDWCIVSDPLRRISEVYEFLFLFYIFFMCFGVLNVVVGAFVATASQLAAKDREVMVKYTARELDNYTNRIKGFFMEADVDKSGTLSWEEFRTHLRDPKVQAYFQALELDVSQAHILFDLLDSDGNDCVTIEEFVEGCIRLRGQARSIDLNMLVFMCNRIFEQIGVFMTRQDSFEQEIRSSSKMSMRASAPP